MNINKRAIFEDDEGNCCIIAPTPDALKNGRTLEDIFSKASGNKSYDIVELSDIPKDRYFRGAWRKNGKKIEIDMEKARGIQMGIIREKRGEKLKELDIETLKGKDVQASKQVLRDIPQKFDLTTAKTPEELKEMMPEELID